jgi:uncharacterized protein (DUF302 family)
LYYIVETDKSFDQASKDLEVEIARLGFGVLHVYDMGAILRGKGVDFDKECRIFEICNPGQAAKIMAADFRFNMALPCRISVFTEKGRTKIGLLKLATLLSAQSTDKALSAMVKEVELITIEMVDSAR